MLKTIDKGNRFLRALSHFFRWSFFIGLIGFAGLPLFADVSWDSERLNLETRMQARVEEALSKILSPGKFVVVIHVEPLPIAVEKEKTSNKSQEAFFLPGVPVRNNYDETAEQVQDLVSSLKSDSKTFQRFIKRIAVTLVLDKRLPADETKNVQDLTAQMLGLDFGRGDTLDIQRSDFHSPSDELDSSSIFRIQKKLTHYWLLISLAVVLFSLIIFFLFIFGPFRGFLNRFVQVLPTLRPMESSGASPSRPDMQMLPTLLSQAYGVPLLGQSAGQSNFSGSLHVENPQKSTTPFGFIREGHLGNLAILLSRETPEKAAVVLGYLPPEWISRVLSRLDQGMQTEIATHLATSRQLLPEQVEDIEQDLKRRLDYLIGGPDRIFAVYESLDTEAQKKMVESLKETRPDLAEELRRRTMTFEDLERLEPAALKAVLREIDLKTTALSLRGVPETLKKKVLEHVSEGKAQIIREEIELNDGLPVKATVEAQRLVVKVAKRLEKEGQIQIPQIEETAAPASRYGTPARSIGKVPNTMEVDIDLNADPLDAMEDSEVKEKIRRFMKRRSDQERFPAGPDENAPRPPDSKAA